MGRRASSFSSSAGNGSRGCPSISCFFDFSTFAAIGISASASLKMSCPSNNLREVLTSLPPYFYSRETLITKVKFQAY